MATQMVATEQGSREVEAPVRPSPYRRPGTEVWRILDAISWQRGQEMAVGAARALRLAALEGRIAGVCYVRYVGTGPQDCVGCAVGTLAIACGYREYAAPRMLPWWGRGYGRRHGLTPLENWVRNVEQGETPATNEKLRVLVAWLDQWAAKTGVTLD